MAECKSACYSKCAIDDGCGANCICTDDCNDPGHGQWLPHVGNPHDYSYDFLEAQNGQNLDGVCRDGGTGSVLYVHLTNPVHWCAYGTDCADCGPRCDPPPGRRLAHTDPAIDTNHDGWTDTCYTSCVDWCDSACTQDTSYTYSLPRPTFPHPPSPPLPLPSPSPPSPSPPPPSPSPPPPSPSPTPPPSPPVVFGLANTMRHGGCRACKQGAAAGEADNHGPTTCQHHIGGTDDNFAKKADRLGGTDSGYGLYALMTNAQCAAACETKTYPQSDNAWSHPDYSDATCGTGVGSHLNAQCVSYGEAAVDFCTESDPDCYRPNTYPPRRYSNPIDGDTCYGYEIRKYNTNGPPGGYANDVDGIHPCELWTVPFVWLQDGAEGFSLKYNCSLSDWAQGFP